MEQSQVGDAKVDAGAIFVLESKGKWWHAGYHLTTAIVGPPILTLPYVFRGLGWVPGFISLTAMTVVSFYSYYLMSLVLHHCETAGRRHIRFRELSADVLGSRWVFYFVSFVQSVISAGVTIGCIILAGESLQILYSDVSSGGTLKLYEAIAIVVVVMIIVGQLPSFHSLRYINLTSSVLCLGYTFLTVGACIHAGLSGSPPARDYSLEHSTSAKTFNAFSSISIIATIFGNSILPEIQATVEPPTTGKMLKGLVMCYSVIVVTFYSLAISGYWAFGNRANSNILSSLSPDDGPALAPTWVIDLAVAFVLFQLFAINMVYCQVAYEAMEKRWADATKGVFSKRNLVPRILLRSGYVIISGFVAAMLPFFGDINGVLGAVGFVPLDFILPMLLYNVALKPPKSSVIYWVNIFIIVCFTGVGLLGSFSTVRTLVLDVSKFKLFSGTAMN